MRNRRASLSLIFGVIFIDLVGFGIVIPILPLYAERFGASPLTIGVLLGIYSLMQMIFAPILGRWSDRIGRRPLLLVSMIGSALGFLLMGLAQALPLLFIGRIIDGITGGNISTAQAYIADVTPPKERSRGMGLIGAAFGLGFIFGPAIGGVMSHFSLSAPLFFAAALAAANAAAIYFFLPESLPAGHRAATGRDWSLGAVFREAKGSSLAVVLGAYFFTTMAFSILTATYPLFASRRMGYQASQIGYIFAGMGILGAIVQGGLMGWLVRRVGDRLLVLAGSLFLGAALFVLPFFESAPLFLAATAGLALGHSLTVAPLNGLASKEASPQAQGHLLGMMQSTASLARVLGPVLGGWLLSWDLGRPLVGRAPYWTAGALTLVGFGLALSLKIGTERS